MKRAGIVVVMLIGAGLFGEGGYMTLKAALAQNLISMSWQQRLQDVPPEVPWPWADTRAVAKLEFADRSESQMVMQDASGESLAFGPGMVMRVASGAGPIVIAGHRDTHFTLLQHVSIGESIYLEHWHGQRQGFRVTDTRVIDTRTEAVSVEQNRTSLTLVTCWPFDALVPGGPERFIVTAEPTI